jgi:hypothetical protein
MTQKLLKCIDCTGGVHFYLYQKSAPDSDTWELKLESNCTWHVYEDIATHNFDLRPPVIYGKPPVLSAAAVGAYDPNRKSEYTAYDNYMVYWTLENKPVTERGIHYGRVTVYSDQPAEIEDFIKRNTNPAPPPAFVYGLVIERQ